MSHGPAILLRGIFPLACLAVLPACSASRPDTEGGQPTAPERVTSMADDYKPFHAVNPRNPKVFFEITIGGKDVGFGQVVTGYDVVKKIEAVGSRSGQTSAEVTISDCGKVE